MRKLISAAIVCAVAVGLVAVPNALAAKSPKIVTGFVTVGETPSPLPNTTASVAATGNVASNSSCRKGRTVRFAWVDGTTLAPISTPPETTLTNPNGDYSASVSRPTATFPTTSSVKLRVTVDQAFRRVGKKKGAHNKRGRQFNCLSITADSSAIPLSAS